MGSVTQLDFKTQVEPVSTEFTRLPDIELYRQRTVGDATRIEARRNWRAQIESLARAFPDADRKTISLAVLSAYICRVAEEKEATFELINHTVPSMGGQQGIVQVAIDERESFASFMPRVAVQQMKTMTAGRNQPAFCLDDKPQISVSLGNRPQVAPDADFHVHIDDEGMLEACTAGGIAAEFGERVIERLVALGRSIARDCYKPLVLHDVMSVGERETVLNTWNETDIDYGYDGGLVAMMQRAAARSPEHPAVIFKDEEISFAEFNSRVNRLARQLISAGVEKDSFVGICMERSVELVVAIWAILKAGGAYVPLNTEDPKARIAEIISDCQPKAVLTQAQLADRVPPSAKVITLGAGGEGIEEENDADLDFVPDPDALAYMIYTSGSTGKPKGVIVEHEAIHNRVVWMHEEYGLEPGDRILQKTPYTFDVSVWEFLWSFAYGSTLVVCEPNGHVAMRYMHDLIRDRGVTHLHFVPSVMRLFLMLPTLKELPIKKLFCSGEALGFDSVMTFYNKANDYAEVHNLYGPTEAAVDVSYFHCRRDPADNTIPIGKPVANTGLYVLDEYGEPCPVGVPGELHIGGIQLARGYWAREDLTAQRFVPCFHADTKHKRLYKTGDLAYFRRDGEIVYLGRNDFQVKINGVRIELGEIESVIRSDAATKDVVVVAEEVGGNKVLIAYVVSTEPGTKKAGELKELVAASRPPYYVPREVRFLKEMPLTVSGKINRKLLADAEQAA